MVEESNELRELPGERNVVIEDTWNCNKSLSRDSPKMDDYVLYRTSSDLVAKNLKAE